MDTNKAPKPVQAHLAARIVRSYVGHHGVAIGDLSDLIATVQHSLGRLGQGAPIAAASVPAVSINRSVRRGYVVCLECGFRSQMLRRHLRTGHGLDAAEYRARWNLSPGHALIAPAYSARRSALAKQFGLGRKPSRIEADPPASDAVPPHA